MQIIWEILLLSSLFLQYFDLFHYFGRQEHFYLTTLPLPPVVSALQNQDPLLNTGDDR